MDPVHPLQYVSNSLGCAARVKSSFLTPTIQSVPYDDSSPNSKTYVFPLSLLKTCALKLTASPSLLFFLGQIAFVASSSHVILVSSNSSMSYNSQAFPWLQDRVHDEPERSCPSKAPWLMKLVSACCGVGIKESTAPWLERSGSDI